MAGTKNGTLVGKNADFTQVDGPNSQSSENNGLITNGQMWIGSTALNAGGTHVNVGTLTSSDASITFGYSSPNITATITGGSTVGKTITGNTGGALPPSAGNWNIVGSGVISTNGVGSTLTISSSGISQVNVQRFTASGAFTYTPTIRAKFVIVELCGAGGGGGGCAATTANLALAGSGAGGAYARFLLTAAQIGASLSGSVGAAGAGGAAGNNNGTAGGNTTLATAAAWTVGGGALGTGGAAGTPANSSASSGGTVTTGTGIILNTSDGGFGSHTAGLVTGLLIPGLGGCSLLGVPGYMASVSGIANGASAGTNAVGFGAGGTGACAYGTNTARAGGNGAGGIAIFTEFI
jgi:hypothetical protein